MLRVGWFDRGLFGGVILGGSPTNNEHAHQGLALGQRLAVAEIVSGQIEQRLAADQASAGFVRRSRDRDRAAFDQVLIVALGQQRLARQRVALQCQAVAEFLEQGFFEQAQARLVRLAPKWFTLPEWRAASGHGGCMVPVHGPHGAGEAAARASPPAAARRQSQRPLHAGNRFGPGEPEIVVT